MLKAGCRRRPFDAGRAEHALMDYELLSIDPPELVSDRPGAGPSQLGEYSIDEEGPAGRRDRRVVPSGKETSARCQSTTRCPTASSRSRCWSSRSAL